MKQSLITSTDYDKHKAYAEGSALQCCSFKVGLVFLLWVMELSKRHASAQMEHRYMTQNVPCHMVGTVNATGPWSSLTSWGVISPRGESSSTRVE